MPASKRPLADVEVNVNTPRPTKRAATTTAVTRDKENAAPVYKTLTVAQLTVILKARSLPYSGKKDDLILRLIDADAGKEYVPGTSLSTDSRTRVEAGFFSPPQWYTHCRPVEDAVAELKIAHDTLGISDEIHEELYDTCGTSRCICNKPLASDSNWKWVISKNAFQAMGNLRKEAEKRDQDAMGEYFYNDFSGYGFQEVVENQLLVIDTELRKSDSDPFLLWQHIETFAYFLPGDGAWFMSDDSERILQTLKLVGGAVSLTLQCLEENDLLKPDSSVRNIVLVLAKFVDLGGSWPGSRGTQPELSWIKHAIEKAEAHRIVFTDFSQGINKEIAGMKKAFNRNRVRSVNWEKFNWPKEFKTFSARNGINGRIGGSEYDLTKKKNRSRAEMMLGPSLMMW